MTVVLKPEEGGQSRVRFLDSVKDFIPTPTLKSDSPDQHLAVDGWKQLAFRHYLEFNETNWNVPQTVLIQTQAVEMFAEVGIGIGFQ